MTYGETIKKLDFTKSKNFCWVKDKFKRMRRQAKDWEKTFAKYISDKVPLSKICKFGTLKSQQ